MPAAVELTIDTPGGVQSVNVSAEDLSKPLTAILAAADLPLNTRCGERGICDGCTVALLGGKVIQIETGEALTAGEGPRQLRACRYRPAGEGDLHLRIPARALRVAAAQVVTHFTVALPPAADPLIHGLPIAEGDAADAAGLAQQLGTTLPIDVAGDLPPAPPAAAAVLEYWEPGWHVTGWLPVDEPQIGAAVDVGTTTVALLLVDMASGEILAEASAFNNQIRFGDNVLSRIDQCARDPGNLAQQQRAVLTETIVPLLDEACRTAKLNPQTVRTMALAGNTTMLHLLAGVDPSPLGVVPFTPPFLEHRRYGTLPGLPEGLSVHLLPSAAAYIGADITSGILASGLHHDEGPSLLVDVGTNGEIVLKHGAQMFACSTAAGPAFEGSGLHGGMRAVTGAVSHLRIDAARGDVELVVIGDQPPRGLCGSAYIDFLADGRRAGLLTRIGRFPARVPERFADRFLTLPDGPRAFRVGPADGAEPIVITEHDVARLLPAKAAIATGIDMLLARAGIAAADVRAMYLAGGFGIHLQTAAAIASGLLPGFAPEQIRPVGNTALAGAYLALLDVSALREIDDLRRRIEIIELNRDPSFQGRFVRHMRLPEPEA